MQIADFLVKLVLASGFANDDRICKGSPLVSVPRSASMSGREAFRSQSKAFDSVDFRVVSIDSALFRRCVDGSSGVLCLNECLDVRVFLTSFCLSS